MINLRKSLDIMAGYKTSLSLEILINEFYNILEVT